MRSSLLRQILALGCMSILTACSSLMMSGGTGTYSSKDTQRTATQTARDSAITSEVRAQHRNDPVVSKYAVGVQTTQGRVTLTGVVGTYEARNQAYRIARTVDGVTAVINQIRVDDQSK